MIKISSLFFLTLLAAATLAQTNEKVEKELLKIQDEWATARVKRDVPYLEKLYAKEFWISNMSGSVTSRSADIAAFASGDMRPVSVVNEDMVVSAYDKVAIVTGIEKVKGTYKNFPGDFVFRFTNVFVRRDGRWQMVTHHSTPVQKR
jgi:ketosteroid isomerase-like protein